MMILQASASIRTDIYLYIYTSGVCQYPDRHIFIYLYFRRLPVSGQTYIYIFILQASASIRTDIYIYIYSSGVCEYPDRHIYIYLYFRRLPVSGQTYIYIFILQASASIRTDMMKYSTELESLRDELIRSATQHRLYPTVEITDMIIINLNTH